MNKVFDNGTMRDATTQEQQEINMNLGGGTGRYELIKEITVEENTHQFVLRDLSGYDEILIEAVDVLADEAKPLNLYTYCGSNTAGIGDAGTLSTTTPLSLLAEYLRKTENVWTRYYSTANKVTYLKQPSITNYDEKINQVDIICGKYFDTSKFTQGTFRIYGRNIKE